MSHAQVTAEFSSELHPHAPAGSSTGGQFTKSGGGSTSKSAHTTPRKRRRRRTIPHGQLGFDGVHGTGYGMPHGDPRVAALQRELNRLGLTDMHGRKLVIDGKLGPLTTSSIRAAQRRLGMKPTGIIAPAFIDRLKATKTLPPAKPVHHRKPGGSKQSVHAKFNPDELRNPDGTWTESPVGAVKDALKLAGRIQLGNGETLAGSGVLRTDGGLSLPMAWIHGSSGTKLRLGVGIPEEDDHKWSASDRGLTVVLDEAGVTKLADATQAMRAAGKDGEKRVSDLDHQRDQLLARQRELIRRQYPNLPKDKANNLDNLDEHIHATTSRIESLQGQNDAGFADLPDAAKARWREIDAEIARLVRQNKDTYAQFWADGGKDNSLIDAAHKRAVRVEDLLDEQAKLHTERGHSDYTFFYKQRLKQIEALQRKLDTATEARRELTGDPVELSAADKIELQSVSDGLARNDADYSALADESELASGDIQGGWGDIAYRTYMTDTGAHHQLGVGETDSESADFTDAELADLERMLVAGPGGAGKVSASSAEPYISMPKNAAKYSPEDLAKVKAKIRAALKRYGVEVADDGKKVAAAELRGIELARPGTWKLASGPLTVTDQHITDAARYANRKGARPGYVKIGHTDPRFQVGDGEPALGWVHNIRREVDDQGPVLLGDALDMPEWFAAAAKTAWPYRSIEGWADYTDPETGEKYALVVDGVAVLGVTPPGMTSLKSLRDLPKAVGIAAASGVRVVASMASAPVAAEEGAGQMDPAKTRDALGLAADASDEEVRSAMVVALQSLGGDAGPAQQPVQASLFGDEPTPASQKAAKPAPIPDGMMLVSASAWQQREDAIANLTTFMQQSKRNERDDYLAKAVQAGKFTPAQKTQFAKLWDGDPDATREYIDSMTPNSALAVMASGYAGSVETDDFEREYQKLVAPLQGGR